MKFFTKTISFLLILSLLLSLSPQVFAAEETVLEENGFTYTIENGEATVVKGPEGQFETLEIPETLGGCPVTALGASAFSHNHTQAKAITIPDTVRTFDSACFYGNYNIVTLNLPENLSYVGDRCFERTNLSFDSLTLNLSYLGMYAFNNVKINHLVLEGDLTQIGTYAFDGSKIQSLTLPHSLKRIGNHAFDHCLLTILTVPENVEYIGAYAFANSGIHTLELPDSLLYIGERAFQNNDLWQVTLPRNLECLEGSAFDENEYLTQLEIPESLIYFGYWYTNQAEITGPADSIAAAGCLMRNRPYRDIVTGELLPAKETVLVDGVHYTICGEMAVVTGYEKDLPKDVVIPETVSGKPVKAIWFHAFSSAPAESIVLPESIIYIDYGAFRDCDKLASISFPESLQCVNDYIFYDAKVQFCYIPSPVKYLVANQKWSFGIRTPDIILCRPDNAIAEVYNTHSRFVALEENRQYLLYDQGLYSTADGKTLRVDKLVAKEETYIPDYINEMPVTELLPQAICSNHHICDIYFGNCITAIPEDVFVDFLPGHVYFPPSITAIDEMFLYRDYISEFYMVVHEETYAHHYAIIYGMRSIVIPKMRFTDVKPESWYYDSVKYVFENGLMQGTSTTRFDPHGTMTRAMLAQVLFNLAGDESFNLPSPFADVPANAWYAQAVSWAAWCGLVTGVSSTEFKPNDPVTREQMVTIFYRFANALQLDTSGRADLSSFEDDHKISSYAADAFSWAVEAGIINGVTDTKLDPKGLSNRAQVATVIARFMQWFSAQ